MKMKTLKVLIPLFMITFYALIPFDIAFAEEGENPCEILNLFKKGNVKACVFKKIVDAVAPEIDITRTAQNVVTELATGVPSHILLNKSTEDLYTCALYNLKTDVYGDLYSTLPEDTDTIKIKGMIDEAEKTVTNPEDCDFNETLGTSGGEGTSMTSGSLAGVTQVLYTTTLKDPIPVNYAYWFDQVKENSILADQTTYAAIPESTTKYAAFGLELIFGFWRILRNFSYALLSIVMVVIAIMIMMKRQMSPQVVVTAQNALPRIVISAVLITFSYPIGAFLASLILPLNLAAVSLVVDALISEAKYVGGLDYTSLVGMFAIILSSIGAAFTAVFFTGIALIVTVVLTLIACLKALFIYFRILISIVLSPVIFAVGAIPGNNDTITHWFKDLAAKVLSIPAMVLMMAFAWAFPPLFFLQFRTLGASSVSGNLIVLATHSILLFLVPLFMMALLVKSLSAPKMIEGFIMGPEKGKRR